jgi:hypothetical protein
MTVEQVLEAVSAQSTRVSLHPTWFSAGVRSRVMHR